MCHYRVSGFIYCMRVVIQSVGLYAVYILYGSLQIQFVGIYCLRVVIQFVGLYSVC